MRTIIIGMESHIHIYIYILAYVDPYVIVYGGNQDIDGDPNSNLSGTNDLWVWNSQQGAWYHPNVAVSSGNTMPGQVFFAATHVPSPGQMLAIASNTSGGASSLQKLDTNSWSWSFPTASTLTPNMYIKVACMYIIIFHNNRLIASWSCFWICNESCEQLVVLLWRFIGRQQWSSNHQCSTQLALCHGCQCIYMGTS